jgi:hypothetical protein
MVNTVVIITLSVMALYNIIALTVMKIEIRKSKKVIKDYKESKLKKLIEYYNMQRKAKKELYSKFKDRVYLFEFSEEELSQIKSMNDFFDGKMIPDYIQEDIKTITKKILEK